MVLGHQTTLLTLCVTHSFNNSIILTGSEQKSYEEVWMVHVENVPGIAKEKI
jgi:hypothetical protein